MGMERKLKKYSSFILESKEGLEQILDSLLELKDDNFLTYNGLSIIDDPRYKYDNNKLILTANFQINNSDIIDKTNIEEFIRLYDTLNAALQRVDVEDFFIKKSYLKIVFNINEISKKFISNLEIGDYNYYINSPFYAVLNIEIKDDFTFILKLYAEDIPVNLYPDLGTKETLIEYFKQFNIEYVDCIKEPNKYDQYIFKGNFI